MSPQSQSCEASHRRTQSASGCRTDYVVNMSWNSNYFNVSVKPFGVKHVVIPGDLDVIGTLRQILRHHEYWPLSDK